ncbi:MAG: hypothetical protein K8L99_36305 [Anaerolineae bacterium]|nr:hypothetical protein [Anaerolineae bacterium]
MRRVKITLPAAVTDLGAGVHTLGLAVGLYTTIEISERRDSQLIVETEGEGAGHFSVGLRHPVVLAMIRIFQKLERTQLGLNLRITNHIPLDSGLGADAAFTVGGLIGANNLLGNVYNREQILQLAAEISESPDAVTTTLFGGLTTSLMDDGKPMHRSLSVSPQRVIVLVPELERYANDIRTAIPERVRGSDATYNLQRLPLLLEGLRTGDLSLIERGLTDRLHTPFLTPHISGYGHVIELLRRAHVHGVTLCGQGPGLLIFTRENPDALAEALVTAFDNAGVDARAWVVPIDTQGVVLSATQSA